MKTQNSGGILGRFGTWLRPGLRGESMACRQLESEGCRILARNYRCRGGEIDIVVQDGEATVFVEVKERQGSRHGAACETVTRGKRGRIVLAARLFASQRGLSERPLRFDVVSIDWDAEGAPHIRHDRGAFDSEGK
jgi:putative endonuclease